MNFQALHFSSEDEFDDFSVDSYESSDEEGDMVGGSFSSLLGNNKKDPETESFLKKLFYYSHMDGDDVAFEIKFHMNADDRITELRRKQKINEQLVMFEHDEKKKEKLIKDLPEKQKALQEQIDNLTFDIRILHYIDVLMQIKTCEENTSYSRNEFDKINNKLNKDSLKWLYHEYITDDKERNIFYENVLFHDTSFRYDETYTQLFNLMNHYYFLYFSCYKIPEGPKYPNKMKKKSKNIGSTYDKINKALILNEKSEFIKTKIEKIMNFLYPKNCDLIHAYIENIQKKIGPYDIQLKENSSTEGIARIQNQISNFLNDEYFTNENNEKSNNPMINKKNLKIIESLDETIMQFWKDNQYENIPFDGNANNYPFLIINQRKHTFPRFSIVFDKDTYAENVKKWFELCHTYEFTPISAENTMGLTEQYYNGLNVRFAYDYKNYYPFEIRFHTLETFMMKEIPHSYLETLVEGIGAYEFNTKIKNGKEFLIMVQNNPPEIIEPIINDIIRSFENLKQKFESTSHKEDEYKQNDDEMEEPVDFVNYITNEEKTLTKHQYKTILYFLIANQSEEDLKLALGKKKKSSEFVKFEDIYQDVYNDSLNDDNYLYDEILNSIFSNYLEYLKKKMYTDDVTNLIAKRLMQGDINYSTDTREFIQQPDISYLKTELQKICNDNMILKHFIPNDPRIRFDIEESKTPPEEPFNPFPNLLGYELIVNDYMKFVMNSKSVEATPLSGVEGSKESMESNQSTNSPENEKNIVKANTNGESEEEGPEMKRDDDDEEGPEMKQDDDDEEEGVEENESVVSSVIQTTNAPSATNNMKLKTATEVKSSNNPISQNVSNVVLNIGKASREVKEVSSISSPEKEKDDLRRPILPGHEVLHNTSHQGESNVVSDSGIVSNAKKKINEGRPPTETLSASN